MDKGKPIQTNNELPRPVQQFTELTKIEGHVDEATVAAVYDQLPSVEPAQLIGQWEGGSFDTGHSTHKALKDYKWAGKDYRTVDDVDPVMVYAEDGTRKWMESFGHARVRCVCVKL